MEATTAKTEPLAHGYPPCHRARAIQADPYRPVISAAELRLIAAEEGRTGGGGGGCEGRRDGVTR
jgi:hypothetical protein